MKMLLPMLLMAGISHAKENRIKIAVIDSGISHKQSLLPYMCKNGVRNATEHGKSDVHGHGSHIVHIIGSRIDIKKYCIVSYKVWHSKSAVTDVLDNTYRALTDVSQDNTFKYVNVSMSGGEFYKPEYIRLKQLLEKGVKISVAIGNNSTELYSNQCRVYPACYRLSFKENFYVVQAKDVLSSNKAYFAVKEQGRAIASWQGVRLSGSSQATALFTSKLIKSDNK